MRKLLGILPKLLTYPLYGLASALVLLAEGLELLLDAVVGNKEKN